MGNEVIAHIRQRAEKSEIQPLKDHLSNVAFLCGNYAKIINLEKAGQTIGLLHDLGKASKDFQNYIQSAQGFIDTDCEDFLSENKMRGKIDHSSAGAQYLYQLLSKYGIKGSSIAQILSLCIASHHSGLIDCLTPGGLNNFQRRIEKDKEATHFNEAINQTPLFIEKDYFKSEDVQELIQELVNKMSSMREEQDTNETLAFKHGLLARFLFSCLIDADHTDSADFENEATTKIRQHGKYVEWNALIRRLDEKLKEFEQNENKNFVDRLREEVSEACFKSAMKEKGIFRLTVPTGGGKTLASLRFALKHAEFHGINRIFYIIPYTSIIDQNAEEVRKIFKEAEKKENNKSQIILEHHSNLMPELETKRQAVLAENWDAPIIFTTQVQFLEALFGAGTRGARRMHQLANAVIIFDEIQTLPIRCVHMFNLAIRFLVHDCRSSVVLCTATQPLLEKVTPNQYSLNSSEIQSLVSNERRAFTLLKRVDIHDVRKAGGWKEEEIGDLAIEEMEKNRSTLIIVNTKKAARSLYQQIQQNGIDQIKHLSTNMCAAHRLDVLREIKQSLEKKKPIICVSTQLIEAGVDIDFGSVIRLLAGFDRIAQAAGRCNRHGERRKGDVWIINPANENLDRLREIRIGGDNAMRILDEYDASPQKFDHDLLGLAAMERFFDYYFYERRNEMAYPIDRTSLIGRTDTLFNLLACNSLSEQAYLRSSAQALGIPLRQSFQSANRVFQAIDSPTRGVIVPYGNEGKRIISELGSAFAMMKEQQLLKKCQRYTVNMYANELKHMAEIGAINETKKDSGILTLNEQHYSEILGWNTEEVSNMETLIY